MNATNDAGVWAMQTTGSLGLLFREGDMIFGKKLKSFDVLNAVHGSTGVTRAFNNAALVAWRARFVNGDSAVMVTSVP